MAGLLDTDGAPASGSSGGDGLGAWIALAIAVIAAGVAGTWIALRLKQKAGAVRDPR
jgi:hypothetical protein